METNWKVIVPDEISMMFNELEINRKIKFPVLQLISEGCAYVRHLNRSEKIPE